MQRSDSATPIGKFDPEINTSLSSFFSSYPAMLQQDFNNAALQGAGVKFVLELSEHTLSSYGCSPQQIFAVKELMQLLIAIVTGSFLANSAGFLTSATMKWYGCKDEHCEIGSTVAAASVQVAQNLSLVGAARTVTQIAGGYAGSMFTMWAKQEIKSLDNSKLTPSESAKIDSFVQLAYM